MSLVGDKNVTTTHDKNVTSFVAYLITKLPSFLDLLFFLFFLNGLVLIQERKQNLRKRSAQLDRVFE